MILCTKWFGTWAAAILLLSATAPLAQQASKPIDPQRVCQAGSQAEINQCVSERYKKADARVNAVYRRVVQIMEKGVSDAQSDRDPDLVKYNQRAIEKLRMAERAWIRYRDLHCEADSQQYEGGAAVPMYWGLCMERTTADRVEELKRTYENEDQKLE
jgi:uncharacterized protein YecT (DUF1311 family)